MYRVIDYVDFNSVDSNSNLGTYYMFQKSKFKFVNECVKIIFQYVNSQLLNYLLIILNTCQSKKNNKK